MVDDVILEPEGLTKEFSGVVAVKDVNLSIRRGAIHALIGPNGVGKTTTMKSILGGGGRRAGSVAYDGRETIDLASHRIARLGLAPWPAVAG